MRHLQLIFLLTRIRNAMVNHAIEELPNECCGILVGRGGKIYRSIPMKNQKPSPFSFFMDPQQQIEIFSRMRTDNEILLGIYHSHPAGPSHPSETDLQLTFHPDIPHFIISLQDNKNPEVRAFILKDALFKEIPIQCIL